MNTLVLKRIFFYPLYLVILGNNKKQANKSALRYEKVMNLNNNLKL